MIDNNTVPSGIADSDHRNPLTGRPSGIPARSVELAAERLAVLLWRQVMFRRRPHDVARKAGVKRPPSNRAPGGD